MSTGHWALRNMLAAASPKKNSRDPLVRPRVPTTTRSISCSVIHGEQDCPTPDLAKNSVSDTVQAIGEQMIRYFGLPERVTGFMRAFWDRELTTWFTNSSSDGGVQFEVAYRTATFDAAEKLESASVKDVVQLELQKRIVRWHAERASIAPARPLSQHLQLVGGLSSDRCAGSDGVGICSF